MFYQFKIFFLSFYLLSSSLLASELNSAIVELFKKDYLGKQGIKQLDQLRIKCLKLQAKVVPSLIEVMKGQEYPDRNRWLATFLLARIMGKKASAFIANFIHHPLWIMRLAGLKTLLALKEMKYGEKYAQALSDNSLFVRQQALDNIIKLKLYQFSDIIWNMLFDKKNYEQHGDRVVRMPILSKVIRAMGDLNYKKVSIPLTRMIAKKQYESLVYDIDYSLSKIFDIHSPPGGIEAKQKFWLSYQNSRDLKTI